MSEGTMSETGHYNPVIAEIDAERCRQIEVEGWTVVHDDTHDRGEMAGAAAAYALYRSQVPVATIVGGDLLNTLWPWSPDWWKPKTPRRDLIRAAALIVAEIERLDRAHHRETAP